MFVLLQKLAKHQIVSLLLVLLSGSLAYAQSPSLSLASGSALQGGSVSLNLSLNAGTSSPAGLQWSLSYPVNDVSSLALAAGSALTSAGKTLNCSASAGSVICVASGINTATIGSGVVAVVTATLSPTSSSTQDLIPLNNTMGALSDGTSLSVSGSIGTISVTIPNPVPSISSLSPASATAGGAAFTLTVNGSGFIPGSVVNWNGSNRSTTFVSATQLQAAISATDIAAAGTAQVTVFNPAPGGGTSGGLGFTISTPNPVPTISSLSPVSATAGGAAFPLIVNGAGFVSGSVVNWNGTSRTTTFVSSTQLQAAISATDIAVAGTAQVAVFNPAPGGGTSGIAAFTISASNPVPTVSSLSPLSATAGGVAFTLTVNGTGFINGSVVNWNGSSRTSTFLSATQLQAAITAADIAVAGTAQVTVFTPAPGGGTSGAASFTINASNPIPTMGSLSPASATAGGTAFTLTVNGTGFVNGSVVNWNGTSRTTTYLSATQLQAAIAATDIAATGIAQVTVFNPAPGGGTSVAASFTINASNPIPTMGSLSPASATAGGTAFTLTVNGSGFINGSVVNWNGTSRTTTFLSATQVQAAITAADIAAAGTAQVTVFNPAPGGGTSGSAPFTISAPNPVPTITSLSPLSAAAGGAAFTLTVNGTGFINGSVVKWNGASRTTTFLSATQVQAAIAAADISVAGTAQVTVFNPAPGGGTSGSSPFTISASNPVPSVTLLSPTSATAGGAAFTLTVNGTGFINGSVVNWNGTSRTTTFVSATQLQAAITSTDIATAGTAQVTAFNPAPGGGTSSSTGFPINGPITVTKLQCSPTTIMSGGTTSCTVTLSQTAPAGGSTVAITDTNSLLLSVPASIMVANSSTGTFTATAGTVTANQSVTATASMNGSSATALLTVAPNTVTFVQTAANAISHPAKTCSTSLSSGVVAGHIILVGFDFDTTATVASVTDSLGNAFAPVGVQLTSPGGARSQVYYAKSSQSGSETVTVNLSGNSKFLDVYVTEYAGADQVSPINAQAGASGKASNVSSGNASTTVANAMIYGFCIGDSVCTAGAGFTGRSTAYNNLIEDTVAVSAGSYAATGFASGGWTMQMVALKPASTVTPASLSTPITAMARPAPGSSSGTGTADGSEGVDRSHAPHVLTSLSCAPQTLQAGAIATCELRMAAHSALGTIRVSSSSPQVKIPTVVSPRANQTSLTFQVSAEAAARQQSVTVTATAGSMTVQDTLQIAAAGHPILSVPGRQTARPGAKLQFLATAADPAGLPLQLSASGVPAGASFDAESGAFEWTPEAGHMGRHQVTFTAANQAGQWSSAQVTIEVTSGGPTLANADRACSPGGVAALSGSWLIESREFLSDPSGNAMDLGGTKVKVNGQYASVLSASQDQVRFLCPVLDAGTALEVAVETKSGSTKPLSMVMQAAEPRIFSLVDSNQGVVSFAGSEELAMARNAQVAGHPAQAGDVIVIWGSGFGAPAVVSERGLSVKIGDMDARVESIRAVPGYAGVYSIQVQMPFPTVFGDAVPLELQMIAADGKVFASNGVTIAVEQGGQ